MRVLLILAIFFITACAKPRSLNQAGPQANPLYVSSTAVVLGADTPCEGCLILETQGNAIRVNFSNHPLEECAGQGSGTYNSAAPFVSPTAAQPHTDYVGDLAGSEGSDPNCFPGTLVLQMDTTTEPWFNLSYQGRTYTLRRIN